MFSTSSSEKSWTAQCALDDVHAFAVRADEAAAVDLDFVVLADKAELDRVPEQAAEFLQHFLIVDGRADAAVVLEEIAQRRGAQCMGTWPKTSWKMSGSGVYSSDSRLRSQVVVGKRRAASISKNAGAGRKPLTGVEFQPVRGRKAAR